MMELHFEPEHRLAEDRSCFAEDWGYCIIMKILLTEVKQLSF